jgi:hypothetical protein
VGTGATSLVEVSPSNVVKNYLVLSVIIWIGVLKRFVVVFQAFLSVKRLGLSLGCSFWLGCIDISRVFILLAQKGWRFGSKRDRLGCLACFEI